MYINKNLIIQKATLDSGCWSFYIYSNFVHKEVKIQIYGGYYQTSEEIINHLDKTISDIMVERINSFLQMDDSEINFIKEEVNKIYETCIKVTDYGIPDSILEKHNMNYELANKEYFGFKNIDDVFESMILRTVYFDDDNDEKALSFLIEYYTPWDIEHGIIISFINGKVSKIE